MEAKKISLTTFTVSTAAILFAETVFRWVLVDHIFAPLPTGTYPLNPNGSPAGVAGLCSPDGRHLAMMPHPERTFLKWQWGYMPEEWKKNVEASPWLKIFRNAREWCQENAIAERE